MNKKYHKEYDVCEDGKKKRLVYNGPLYRVDMPAETYLQTKIRLLSSSVVMAVLFVAMDFYGDQITRKVYVGLPYAVMVIPVVYAVLDAARFMRRKNEMERIHYEGSFMHMFTSAVAIMILSTAACIGGAVYQIFTPVHKTGEFLFILLAALCSAVAYIFFRQLRVIKRQIIKIPTDSTLFSSTDGAKFL